MKQLERIPKPAATANFRGATRGSPFTRWTMSTMPGLHVDLGMEDEVWRGQKEGSVDPRVRSYVALPTN